jgi:hypothetical protein
LAGFCATGAVGFPAAVMGQDSKVEADPGSIAVGRDLNTGGGDITIGPTDEQLRQQLLQTLSSAERQRSGRTGGHDTRQPDLHHDDEEVLLKDIQPKVIASSDISEPVRSGRAASRSWASPRCPACGAGCRSFAATH